MRQGDGLFARGDAYATFDAHKQKAAGSVDSIPADQFLHSTDDQLVEYVCNSMQIEPLALHDDRATMTQEETKIEVTGDFRYFNRPGERAFANGIRVSVTIPYTGDESLWHIKPSRSYLRTFRAEVKGRDHRGIGSIVLQIERTTDANPDEFKKTYEEEIKLIKEMVSNVNADLNNHMQQLPAQVRQAVQSRRQRLEKQSSVRQVLNIPMATRPGAADVAPLVVPRKLVKPLPPAPSAKPEPTIRDEDYEHMLGVIRHAGRTFEATPATFAKNDEEELRDIVMGNLNGHYQGAAAGERFRKKGKTDICIEDQNRAAFVAECKVWRGAKEAGEAAVQLLSYLTWRDCKCCLVFFNSKVAGFSGVQAALADALRKHPSFVADSGAKEPGEWRFRFRQPGDEQRLVAVHVFCFDLYVKPVEKKGKAKS